MAAKRAPERAARTHRELVADPGANQRDRQDPEPEPLSQALEANPKRRYAIAGLCLVFWHFVLYVRDGGADIADFRDQTRPDGDPCPDSEAAPYQGG